MRSGVPDGLNHICINNYQKNTMSNLQLPLITKWFHLTALAIKPEEYREINDYWCRRLLSFDKQLEYCSWHEMIDDLNNKQRPHSNIEECLEYYGAKFKIFKTTTLTRGYPKKTDIARILKLDHKGIEIRTGNPEWGAEPDKLYFVIKHGGKVS